MSSNVSIGTVVVAQAQIGGCNLQSKFNHSIREIAWARSSLGLDSNILPPGAVCCLFRSGALVCSVVIKGHPGYIPMHNKLEPIYGPP